MQELFKERELVAGQVSSTTRGLTMAKKWVWLIIGAVILATALGCDSESVETQKGIIPRPVRPQPISEIIWAPDLQQAYQQNEVAADERFKGRMIIVMGVVHTIGKGWAVGGRMDTPYVTLRTATDAVGKMLGADYVKCWFADGNIAQLSQLQPGQTVKIQGEVYGRQGGIMVAVRGCSLRP